MYRLFCLLTLHCLAAALPAAAAEYDLNGHRFTLPDGFTIDLVAGPPLVDRPICCDFDEHGRLYVAESSGSNDNVQKQLAEKPHRILRLEDRNGDGRFERRTVFADAMMFPEGAMWLDGSLYVAAPPSIWKLTDSDGDGVAERREEWFQGKTLTGCANDLHGPYRGPDGWVYWCKGAFAEQTYPRPGKQPWVTRAAHIFRRRPEGGIVEPVMTGGMDNPVEVVFTAGGERIFTTTFLQHPGGGRRDGLIHAIYGGVYGKRHGVLDNHPRTGDLMPALVHLGAAAPCGLTRLESTQLGDGFRGNLFAALFNMHKVTRHVLQPAGATFQTGAQDFLVSDNLDFHPTDVIEDADGSLIVIDTGGWYKLCCPTSQLWKPDVLGAIYRLRRSQGQAVDDPWGSKLPWADVDVDGLVQRMADPRPAVRKRAGDLLAKRGAAAVAALARLLQQSDDRDTRTHAVWTLTRIDDAAARAAVRSALTDTDTQVRQAALHSVSVHRDGDAVPSLVQLLKTGSPPNRRAAAEALGRAGDASAVPPLLAATGKQNDRALEHSLTFAMIEIADPQATAAGLESKNPFRQRAALIALDQMEGGDLHPDQVVRHLNSTQPAVRSAAAWIVERHPQWATQLLGYFRTQLKAPGLHESRRAELQRQLARMAGSAVIQQAMADALQEDAVERATKQTVLQAMADSGLKQMPDAWSEPLAALLQSDDEPFVRQAVSTTRSFQTKKSNAALQQALLQVGRNGRFAEEVRLEALAAMPAGLTQVDQPTFALLLSRLPATSSVHARSLAADVLSQARLSAQQLDQLAEAIVDVGPLEIERVLAAFRQSQDEKLGLKLVRLLRQSPGATSIPAEKWMASFASFPAAVRAEVEKLQAALEMSISEQRQELEALMASLPEGNVRRGQQVFHSEKASCFACHAMGYLGGNIGPDLTRIGGIRSQRDLLEAILYPSASFVRSYEPVVVATISGRIVSGLLREDNGLEVVITNSERKQIRIRHDEIDEMGPGKVSVMPAGLDKQLTPQQLADLLSFLKAAQ